MSYGPRLGEPGENVSVPGGPCAQNELSGSVWAAPSELSAQMEAAARNMKRIFITIGGLARLRVAWQQCAVRNHRM